MATFKANLAADWPIFTGDLPETVTYRRCTGSTFDPEAGTDTPTYSDTSVTLVRQELANRLIAAGAGEFQYGDVVLYVLATDLAAEPKRTDKVTMNSETYEVRAWSLEEDENVYSIVVRRGTD